MRTYRIKEIETGEVHDWTLSEILQEINRDRSDEWSAYDESDWREGWLEWCEGDFYHLIDYPKQLHTFPKDEFKNPDGPMVAWVYNGITDPVEPYANYIIEDMGEDKCFFRYLLVIENQQFQSNDLADLEPRLFEWMEDEGVKPKKPERFDLVLQPEPHVWDTKRKQVVFTINAPYAQMICLERSDESGFSGLVEWMNTLNEEDLASEGIE
jgi:hypothetical protein